MVVLFQKEFYILFLKVLNSSFSPARAKYRISSISSSESLAAVVEAMVSDRFRR